MPSVSAHIADGSPLLKEKERRQTELKKNESAYIRFLIERDVAGEGAAPDAMSPRILSELTRRLCGENAERLMNERLGSKNQPLELELILKNYAAHGAEPTMRELFAEQRKFIFQLAQDHLDKALEATAQLQGKKRRAKSPLLLVRDELAAKDAAAEQSKPEAPQTVRGSKSK